jgi:hypothetical protein
MRIVKNLWLSHDPKAKEDNHERCGFEPSKRNSIKFLSTKTVNAYAQLYSGPAHMMHYKYATMMNTVWVTFMYGTALPLLYPVAAITFFNLYVVDKLVVTYYYKEPPSYAEKLNRITLAWLKPAPFMIIFFGFWVMGQP